MNKSKEIDPRLKSVYENKADKQGVYDAWAATYDKDLIDDMGYVADQSACDILTDLVADKSSRILDAGCGTGLVGARLKNAGYSNVDGCDYSHGMLDEAIKTNAYQHLFQHDLTHALSVEEPYDALIAVGLFGFNTPAFEHLGNLCSCLVVDGYAVITVNGKAWRDNDWQLLVDKFGDHFQDIKLCDVLTIDYLTRENIDGKVLVLQRK